MTPGWAACSERPWAYSAAPSVILLGGGVGLLAGSLVDESDAADNTSLLAYSSRSLLRGRQPSSRSCKRMIPRISTCSSRGMDCAVMHWDAAEIADEVDQADQIQRGSSPRRPAISCAPSARQTGTRPSRRSVPRSSRSSRTSRGL